MTICSLRHWQIVRRHSHARATEREYLRGCVYGDSRWPDGTLITTSAIVRRDRNEAVTASGHRYRLEEPALDDVLAPTA